MVRGSRVGVFERHWKSQLMGGADVVVLLIVVLVLVAAAVGWFVYNSLQRRGKVLISSPPRDTPETQGDER